MTFTNSAPSRAKRKRQPAVIRAFFQPLRDRKRDSSDGSDPTVTLHVNKQIRQSLLKQHFLTNQFTGTPLSDRAEAEYHAFVSHYNLRKVRNRLFACAALLFLGTLYDNLASSREVGFIMLRTVAPMVLLILGGVLCSVPRTRIWWRPIVMAVAVLCYVSIICADWVQEVATYSVCDKDYNMEWQLMWLLLVMQVTSFFSALDLVHVAFVLLLQWATFVTACTLLYRHWWLASGQGDWRWPNMELVSTPSLEKVLRHVAPPGKQRLNLSVTNHHDLELPWSALDKRIESEPSSRFIVDSLLIATAALVLLLVAVRRMNRFERQCFVNTFVLLKKVSTQVRQIRGQHVELLALFSNPRVAPNSPIQLRPLQLGQELKHLLRAVPHVHIAVEPAAGLLDVQAAVRRHDPRLILFSGHSFMGSLAFELPNGRIDLPPPVQFIEQLQRDFAPRLECVFLNGCDTAGLAFKMVSQLPWLSAICWCSITEDTAARSFAQGFYDAVGSYIIGGEEVQVTLAYWAGLSRMYAEGLRIGDPGLYLHPPGHAHLHAPDFQRCEGCCPPVHGVVILLSNRDGQVHALMPDVNALAPSEPLEGRRRGSGDKEGSSFLTRLPSFAFGSRHSCSRRASRSRRESTKRTSGGSASYLSTADAVTEHLINLAGSRGDAGTMPSIWQPVTLRDVTHGSALGKQLAGQHVEPRACAQEPSSSSSSSPPCPASPEKEPREHRAPVPRAPLASGVHHLSSGFRERARRAARGVMGGDAPRPQPHALGAPACAPAPEHRLVCELCEQPAEKPLLSIDVPV